MSLENARLDPGVSWADIVDDNDDELELSDAESTELPAGSWATDLKPVEAAGPLTWAQVTASTVPTAEKQATEHQVIPEQAQITPAAGPSTWAQIVAESVLAVTEQISPAVVQQVQPRAQVDSPVIVPLSATPGDPIGLRAVQSILMSATQTNLSHFHTAGMDTINSVSNVRPSATDAMNGIYTAKNTSMRFKSSADVGNIRMRTVGVNLGYFVKTVGTATPSRENVWYEALGKQVHNNILRFYIDYRKMFMHGLTLHTLAENAFGNDCSWNVSPDFMGMIDIITPHEAHMSQWLSRMERHVCGTPSILSCYDLGKEFVTRGSDILAISEIETVKVSTIVSNNVTEVDNIFGIEAAAQILCKLTGQRIVSDFMTRTGKVLPFNKQGEIKDSGLLNCMGFERPKDEIKKAIVSGSIGNVGIYDAIMTGINPWNNMRLLKLQK